MNHIRHLFFISISLLGICTTIRSFNVRPRILQPHSRNRQYNNHSTKTVSEFLRRRPMDYYYVKTLPLRNNLVKGMALQQDKNSKQNAAPKTTGEAILGLAIPALGALLIDPLMTLIDTVFVGRYAETADSLAGMGSAAALLTSTFFVFNFLCTATTPLVSSRRASGNETKALSLGGQALTLAIVLGVIMASGLLLFSQPLLTAMGTDRTGPIANGYALDFLGARSLAAPAVFVGSAATGILRGYLDTKTPIVILVAANLVNVVLDIVLIGNMGLGPMGAAIATTTAEWISAFLFLGVLAGKLPSADGELGSNNKNRTNNVDNNIVLTEDVLVVTPAFSIPPWNEVRPLIVASSSIFLRTAVLQLSLLLAASMAARGGVVVDEETNTAAAAAAATATVTAIGGASTSVAAHQIALQLWLLCSFICDALAAASQGLIADGIGRNDPEAVRDVAKTVLRYSLSQGVLLAIVLYVGSSPITNYWLLNVFTNDIGTQQALSAVLGLVVLAQPVNSLVFAADGIIQGAEEFTFQAKTMAISAFVAWGSFLGFQTLGDDGTSTLVHVWYALIILQIMRGVTSMIKIVDQEGPINMLEPS